MTDTPHLGLPLIEASQAQKHVTHNEAIVALDAIVQLSVMSASLTDPPGAPAEGDRYIPATGATGAWAGWDLNIALYTDGAWSKIVPRTGWRCYVEASGKLYVWIGAAWTDLAAAGGFLTIVGAGNGSLSQLGVNTAADNSNRLAVKSNQVLLSHDDITPGNGSLLVVVNKEDAAKDAGFVFQDGFDTRALIGLLGDDKFTFKVTPDGNTFFEAFTIDQATGAISFPQMPKLSAYINYDHYAALTYVNTDINNEDLDTANAFASNVFTVPRTGVYRLGYSLGFKQNSTNVPAAMHARLLKNGTDELLPAASSSISAANSGKIVISVESIFSLAASDTVQLQHKFATLDGYAAAGITRLWAEQLL